ncbi:MAG: XRE family transcriptional regulator [Pseudomonadota bacterium]
MRSAFGRLAQELRLKRDMNQKEFSELVGLSISHVSNLEHQRAHLSDDTIGKYIAALDCTGDEAHELRTRAGFSNGIREERNPASPNAPLRVMLDQFGDSISETARRDIQRILERETGQQVSQLRFSSNKRAAAVGKQKSRSKRPSMSATRFVDISLLAEDVRSGICSEMDRVDIGLALERLSLVRKGFDYEVSDRLPVELDGAFAAILGHLEGHTILVEAGRFQSALNGVHFARHVLAHEIAHHFLHPELLKSEVGLYLPVQQLAKNTTSAIKTERQIEQVVDTIEEAEAECFATLFLVPWSAFLKGTEPRYLASDYGEQQGEVERYYRFFRNDALLDAFRQRLWEAGRRKHPIFD